MVLAGYITCLARFCLNSGASLVCSLVVSVPHRPFSLRLATTPALMPFLASSSFRKSKALRTNRSSCGVVRKNHLKLRCVSEADEDSGFRKGMPARSAIWLAVAVTALL